MNMIKDFGHLKRELGYKPKRFIPTTQTLTLLLKIRGCLAIEMILSISPAFIFQLGLVFSIETTALVNQRDDATFNPGS
jgi:hypothetical protein